MPLPLHPNPFPASSTPGDENSRRRQAYDKCCQLSQSTQLGKQKLSFSRAGHLLGHLLFLLHGRPGAVDRVEEEINAASTDLALVEIAKVYMHDFIDVCTLVFNSYPTHMFSNLFAPQFSAHQVNPHRHQSTHLWPKGSGVGNIISRHCNKAR